MAKLGISVATRDSHWRNTRGVITLVFGDRQFKVGDKIRVNLHHGKIEDAVVRAVIEHTDGLKLQVDFGHEQTALIDMWQVVE